MLNAKPCMFASWFMLVSICIPESVVLTILMYDTCDGVLWIPHFFLMSSLNCQHLKKMQLIIKVDKSVPNVT